jgi:rhamnogalacturonan acetylesterase
VKTASEDFLSLGAAGVIIAEQLPNNVWEFGNYSRTPTTFSYYDE